MDNGLNGLLQHFRGAFGTQPSQAYRDWFRLQEELRERGEEIPARALADDLWRMLPAFSFSSTEERARFFHNLGVFFGTAGPAADLRRCRECFSVALEHFSSHEEGDWNARVLHNLATAVSHLGTTSQEMTEAVALFEKALAWRNSQREIARGVTLHNLSLALRRLAEMDAERTRELLGQSASALREAIEIRTRHRLPQGRALSLFHLGLTLDCLIQAGGEAEWLEAQECFDRAAEEFERLGKRDSASIARERSAAIHR